MASIKSQIKRNRQNEQARVRNKSVRSALKTSARRVREGVAAGDQEAAEAALAGHPRLRPRPPARASSTGTTPPTTRPPGPLGQPAGPAPSQEGAGSAGLPAGSGGEAGDQELQQQPRRRGCRCGCGHRPRRSGRGRGGLPGRKRRSWRRARSTCQSRTPPPRSPATWSLGKLGVVGDPQQQAELAGDEPETADRVFPWSIRASSRSRAVAASAANTASVSSKMPRSAVWARNSVTWPAESTVGGGRPRAAWPRRRPAPAGPGRRCRPGDATAASSALRPSRRTSARSQLARSDGFSLATSTVAASRWTSLRNFPGARERPPAAPPRWPRPGRRPGPAPPPWRARRGCRPPGRPPPVPRRTATPWPAPWRSRRATRRP